MLGVLRPIGIEAALYAIEQSVDQGHAKRRQVELALEQSRFEATRAQRQFDAVDPSNRLVAGELERRWNERLIVVAQHEAELQRIADQREPALTSQQRQALIDIGADLPRAWDHPNAGNESRKRILRAVIKEIVVRVTDTHLDLMVHWQGGDHTPLSIVRNRPGKHRWTTDIETEQLLTELARLMPDSAIASMLNRQGHRTGKGHTWTQASVRSFRGSHHVAVFRQGEREERGEITLEQAAKKLHLSHMTVLRMIAAGTLPGRQACRGAPWVIQRSDVERLATSRALPPGSTDPLSADPDQISLQFQ